MHVIGPELGVTQPGMTIVCGDSHTATHGAFGALAFGIGTSEVEHVLATQTLAQPKPKSMRITYTGELGQGVTAKDLILYTIGQLGTGGMAGHAVEYAGPAIEGLSMEGRMTICNMTIEGGGRAGMIAPDETTFEWIRGRAAAPEDFDAAVAGWRELRTDDGATLRHRDRDRRGARSRPLVTWGTTPAQVVPVTERRARSRPASPSERALTYMALEPGTTMTDIRLDRVFIGSCTNSRIGDLRAAAAMLDGRKVHPDVRAMVVPGSEQVRRQAEAEGLHERFEAAGFEWRTAGCSMCLGMNEDTLEPGRALRLHLQPQLRGPPGPRRAHPPRLPADGRRRRGRGALRRHPGVELSRWTPSSRSRAPVTVLDRADVDTDQIIPAQLPQARRADGLRPVPVRRVAQGPGVRPARQPDPRRRPELRLRLEPRARPVGAAGLRLPGDRLVELRRHLLLQLPEDRPAAGASCPRRRCAR